MGSPHPSRRSARTALSGRSFAAGAAGAAGAGGRSGRRPRRVPPALAALLALLMLGACAEGPGADPPRARDEKAIAGYLARVLPTGAGGTVVAARGDALAYCGGFGTADRAAGTPAHCHTVYDIMSLTKQFTAAAILRLEVLGKLRVGDRISRFLGPVPQDKRALTIRHLLTHTSGLPEGLGDDYERVSREQLVRRALASKPRSIPGREFHYSNAGYSLLAVIVEKASGQDYERFLARHLFAPAGMDRTGYVLPRWRRHHIAVEYDSAGRSRGRPVDHPWAPDGPYWNLRGNGGMLSTALDMFRWHRALNGDTVLPKRARDELFAPRVRLPGSRESYGYGWVVGGASGTAEGRTVRHDGGNDWSLAWLERSLGDGVMVFWVSNHAYRDGRWNFEDLAKPLTREVAQRVRAQGP